MKDIRLYIENELTRFGFDIIKIRNFKSGFLLVAKSKFVNIAITYNVHKGFVADVLPNKEFLGVTFDLLPNEFLLVDGWESEVMHVIRRALKQSNTIELKLKMSEKFSEITSI